MSKRIKVSTCPTMARLPHSEGLAYAAGLFDGEACIHIAKQRKRQARRGYIYRLTVTVAQNHLDTLTDFQQLCGVEGRIYWRPRKGTSNRDNFALAYDGDAAADLLERLSPLLRRKKDEADVALLFQRETDIHRHFGPLGCPDEIWKKRDLLYAKLRSLK